jgi:signal peptidase
LRGIAWGAFVVLLGTFLATGAVAWHEGYRFYAVRTGSMTPGLPVGSLIVDTPATGSYHRGEVVSVARPAGDPNPVVTHRIHSIGPAGIRTKGDANPKPDVFVSPPSSVVGELAHDVPRAGYVLVYLSHWTGVLSVMTVLLSLWLAWGLCFPATTESEATVEQKVRKPRLRIPRQRQAGVLAAVSVSATEEVVTQPDRQPVSTTAGPVAPAEPRIPQPRGPRA